MRPRIMYQHLEINEAVAGYSEAMESGNHFKNGASSKSQMSRANLKNSML